MIASGGSKEPNAALKILKPWWDVLLKYLTIGILLVALTTAALKAKDNLVCSPAVNCNLPLTRQPPTAPQNHICSKVDFRLSNITQTVITTLPDFMMYSRLDIMCFQKGLHNWYPAWFPFILLTEALLLLLIDNFWVLYPKTSTTLNEFVTLTMKCYACVGKQMDLFRVLSKTRKQNSEKKPQGFEKEKVSVEVAVEVVDPAIDLSVFTPLLQASELETEQKTIETMGVYTMKDIDPSGEVTENIPLSPVQKTGASQVLEEDPLAYHFVLSDAMTVRTLFHKVAEFNGRFGSSTILIKVYRARAVLQILLCVFILFFHYYHLHLIQNVVICHLKEVFVKTDYDHFVCARVVSPYYRAATLIFTFVAFVYLVSIVYTLVWSIRSSVRYDVSTEFKLPGDVVRIKGDLAFLFSLLEQYNKLYCDRLAVFLSQGLKTRLDKKIMSNERRKATVNVRRRKKAKTSKMM